MWLLQEGTHAHKLFSVNCNVSSTFFGNKEEKVDVKNEKVEFIFPTFFVKVAALSFPAKAKLLFFQCYCP